MVLKLRRFKCQLTDDSMAVKKTLKKLKPLCVCKNCGADVVPSKQEAGRFLVQFRETAVDPIKASEYGKRGGRGKKKK